MWLTISIITNVVLLLTVIGLVLVYRKKVNNIELTVKELESELKEFMVSKNKKKVKNTSLKEKTAILNSIVRTAISVVTLLIKIK